MIFAVTAWRRHRPRAWIFPSDALFISCLIFVGLAPLINLRATNAYSVNYAYDDVVIARTLFAIALMFGIFGVVWMLRRGIHVRSLMEGAVDSQNLPQLIFFGTVAACVLSAVLMIVDPDYGQFRADVLSFMTGRLNGTDYQFSRRFAFNENVLISQIISRLRYSVFAFLYAVSAAYLFSKIKNVIIPMAILTVIFFLLSSSVSKLPFVYFFMYAALIFIVLRTKSTLLRAERLLPAVILGGVVTLIFLSGLYMVQYPDQFRGFTGTLDAFNLALYRLFGATYDGMLQYFTVYPYGMNFAYFMDSSIVAFIFDRPARDIITEVPVYFTGEEYYGFTTTPTIFIGGAYASAGYFGVAFYSVLVALFAVWVDEVIVRLRQAHLRVAVYATMMLNIVFFSMIAAPTVFLTYGAALIPLAALALDGQLLRPRAKTSELEERPVAPASDHVEGRV
ncbi:MAG: O-antigen polymerase [Brevundimonas sp.]